jgi:hypothetical protein
MFRHHYLTFLLLCTFTLTAISQKKIFDEDFKNNKNGWRLRNDSNFVVDIRNGMLHIEKLQKNFVSRGCLWYNKQIPELDTRNDFSLVLNAKFLSGDDVGNWIDFQWGNRLSPIVPGKPQPENNTLYQLNFKITGEIRFEYFNNKWNFFVRKDFRELLGEGFDARAINKYEIIQKDSLVIFKINDKEVWKHGCEPIAGNSIGFQQCLKTAWEIDHIIIRQDKKENSGSRDTAKTEAPGPVDITYLSNKQLKVYPNPFDHDLYATVALEKEERVSYSLVDLNGVILQQHSKQLAAGLQTIRLYADVPAGTYILRMEVGKAVMTATVVKQ